jgi:hypothetical protein
VNFPTWASGNRKANQKPRAPRFPKSLRYLVRRKWIVPPPVDELLPIQAKLTQLLARTWHSGNEEDEDVASLAFSLTILWEASKVHIGHIRELTRMADKPDRARLDF